MIISTKKRTRRKVWIFIISFVILTMIFFFLANAFFKDTNIEKTNSTDLIENNNHEQEKNNTKEIRDTNETTDKKENNNITNENNNTINDIRNETEENDNSQNNVKNEVEETDEIKNPREFGSNVAFIGDSRTQAFLMYTGLKDVTDYTNIGLMVDTAVTKKFITNNKGEKITILEDLKSKNIDTIYIMLGINELGWVYNSIFIQKYEELIDKIREIKPSCEIIVQSIIPVTKTKSDNDKIYNNNNKIREYNALIQEMANRKEIQYVDLVPCLVDANGNLPESASPDGIHLNKEYCLKWLECLKNN